MDIRGVAPLGLLAWPFVTGFSGLAEAIPRNQERSTIIGVAALVALLLTTAILHAAYPGARIWTAPSPTTRHFLAVILWIFSLWAIWRRWQTLREQTGANSRAAIG